MNSDQNKGVKIDVLGSAGIFLRALMTPLLVLLILFAPFIVSHFLEEKYPDLKFLHRRHFWKGFVFGVPLTFVTAIYWSIHPDVSTPLVINVLFFATVIYCFLVVRPFLGDSMTKVAANRAKADEDAKLSIRNTPPPGYSIINYPTVLQLGDLNRNYDDPKSGWYPIESCAGMHVETSGKRGFIFARRIS